MDGQNDEIRKLFDGELTADRVKALLERMEQNPRLKEDVFSLHETVRLLETSARLSPSPSFVDAVMKNLPHRPVPIRRRIRDFLFEPRLLRWNVATAAVVLVAAITAVMVIGDRGDVGMGKQALADRQSVPVRFSLYAPGAEQVSLAGDFNRWRVNEITLTRTNNGTWVTELPLEPGTYAYMFVVDGTEWIVDPQADAYRDDGFGYQNSVRRIYSF